MVKENMLFGIDAADCAFRAPFLENYWQHYLDHYQAQDPARLPVIYEMMQRIAHHSELPELVEQELREAPGPVLEHLAHQHSLSDENMRVMHNELLGTLQKLSSVFPGVISP